MANPKTTKSKSLTQKSPSGSLCKRGFYAFPAEIRKQIFSGVLVGTWDGQTPGLLVALRPDKRLYFEFLPHILKENAFVVWRHLMLVQPHRQLELKTTTKRIAFVIGERAEDNGLRDASYSGYPYMALNRLWNSGLYFRDNIEELRIDLSYSWGINDLSTLRFFLEKGKRFRKLRVFKMVIKVRTPHLRPEKDNLNRFIREMNKMLHTQGKLDRVSVPRGNCLHGVYKNIYQDNGFLDRFMEEEMHWVWQLTNTWEEKYKEQCIWDSFADDHTPNLEPGDCEAPRIFLKEPKADTEEANDILEGMASINLSGPSTLQDLRAMSKDSRADFFQRAVTMNWTGKGPLLFRALEPDQELFQEAASIYLSRTVITLSPRNTWTFREYNSTLLKYITRLNADLTEWHILPRFETVGYTNPGRLSYTVLMRFLEDQILLQCPNLEEFSIDFKTRWYDWKVGNEAQEHTDELLHTKLAELLRSLENLRVFKICVDVTSILERNRKYFNTFIRSIDNALGVKGTTDTPNPHEIASFFYNQAQDWTWRIDEQSKAEYNKLLAIEATKASQA